jgi:putative hydrolase of HD superfamily
MRPQDLPGLLDFLRGAERLKATHRSAYLSSGEQESAAEHSWRLSLLAMLVAPAFPDVDPARLLQICIVHDLGEALHGDVPAPEQARMAREGITKSGQERRDLIELLRPLPEPGRATLLAFWDEYEAAATPEAKLAKALDKLETILQHTQGANPPDFDYAFNLDYARAATSGDPLIAQLRAMLDAETKARAAEAP